MSARGAFDSRPVEDWLAQEREAGRLRAGSLAVMRGGGIVHQTDFGTLSGPGSDEVSQDTAFWIASMTKPIVSVAAMSLIAQGRLSRGDPVSRFVPGFGAAGVSDGQGGTRPLERAVSVHHLMTHLSGLTYGVFGDTDVHRAYKAHRVFDYAADNRLMVERLTRIPLLHQPGTVFEYGMSTDMLGRVIEVVTGRPLDVSLQEIVLGPLGMTRTGFRPDPARTAALPQSQVCDALAPPLSSEERWCSGGAGMWSTAADYLKFTRMLADGGALAGTRILSAEALSLMLSDHLPANIRFGSYTANLGVTAPWPKTGLCFGLGLAVRNQRRAAIPGGIGEFLWPGVSGTNFWVDPAHDLIVVFLTHAPDHRVQHREGLRNAVYRGLKKG
ncbi:serine hydrolase domain-containing protein [Paracoccus sediminicola]|uniref:serine hydrolase domain-containing protein n=1 Tax=Paracoccus sediminicola TaxID=3017783 RepID=UPI0022F02FEB|nr:serine hydrolase domain-containing protein [Paracoccus sediminicola]WBU57398.1 serine hydrolase [Paracoccus sediminicola]